MVRTSTSRKVMPQKGRSIRNALYQGAQVPNLALKLAVYEKMQLEVPGLHWYTKHRHLTWCSTTEKTRGISSRKRVQVDDAQLFAMVEREMQVVPDPRLSDIARWAMLMNVSRNRVQEMSSFIAGYY